MNNEEVQNEDTEILDDSSVETEDSNVEPDKRDEQIANLNKAVAREREQNKRLKEQFSQPAPAQQNEDGSIDPNAFAQSVNQQTINTVDNILKDERDWNKATKKHPVLDEDDDLADAIRGYKTSALVNRGEVVTYEEAADKVLGKIKTKTEKEVLQAEDKGRTDAQVSEKIQERAVIGEPSGGKENADENKKAEIMKVLYSPDSTDSEREAAREQLLDF
jgi:hypothetical protein